MALAALGSEAAQKLVIHFDRVRDVLYVSLGKPVVSHINEADHGLLLRRAKVDNRASGVTAIDFRSNWAGDLPGFCRAVAMHLRVPIHVVEKEVKRAVPALKNRTGPP
jgi:hypothetical protein